ncbi:SDR family oxidoreductase [Vibrio sp. 1262-1]|uniref:SDR family NAD(P)-dependent oxidoreductase n=1 Tax=Vibrio sp. 1262-1 TaxID=3074548 RepID=UPI0029656433|nr:SDR family oxidoreductase [Vibrio sp. 1262-1]MDW2402505.1 SDR family oxidoreductase [Vibrio sp. 1262-1]
MNNFFDMTGSVVLVTGATGYLGKQMCLGLGAAGATVLVNSRNLDKAKALVAELTELGFSAEAAHFDVSEHHQVKSYFSNYKGRLNVIINNAYTGKGGTIEASSSEDFTQAYEVTVNAANNLFQCCLPFLKQAVEDIGYASVINVASMYATVSPDLKVYESPFGSNPPFYGAAKAALLQWTRYGACEFGSQGIRFNAISPGPFPNPEFNKQEFCDTLSEKVPMGRIGKSTEIAGPTVFLASQASSFVNGANIPVDGGWTAW